LSLYLFIYNISLLLFSIIIYTTEILLKRNRQNNYKKINDKYADEEKILKKIKLMRMLNMDERFRHLYDKELKKLQRIINLENLVEIINFCFTNGILFLNLGICLYIGYLFYSKGQIDFITMIKIVFVTLYSFNYALDQGKFTVNGIINTIDGGRNVMEIINKTPKINPNSNNGSKKNIKNITLKGKITFKNIWLKPSFSESTICSEKEIIEIQEGKTVAIVGHPEESKTSLIGLIARWYDTEKGEVLIDDRRISDYNVKWLHEQISYIGKDSELFYNLSVRENIKYGNNSKLNINDEEIIEVSKKVDIYDYIMTLPLKYDSHLQPPSEEKDKSEMDIEKRIKLIITRAIIHQPKILLLDHPLSELSENSKSKLKLKEILKNISKDYTTIISTDDILSIENVDMIIVVKDGKIIEVGSHEELINLKGNYYEMVSKKEKKLI